MGVDRELLDGIYLFLRDIKASRKGSIGSMDNAYLPQLSTKRVNDLATNVKYALVNQASEVLDEKSYKQGSRMAWLTILKQCCRHLGYDDLSVQKSSWAIEREETVNALREVCRSFGDNDWDSSLYLVDIIEKHLSKHLHDKEI